MWILGLKGLNEWPTVELSNCDQSKRLHYLNVPAVKIGISFNLMWSYTRRGRFERAFHSFGTGTILSL